MHNILVSVISVLIVLGIMVLVHEFGHFLAAKLLGVRVEQFSIGFPPRLFGVKVGDTDYCISAIPLGGYVKMTGETLPGENMTFTGADGETRSQIAVDPGALTSHPRWQRIIIGLAGPCGNFALALALMTGYYMLHNEVPEFYDKPVTLDWVAPGSAAAQAGFKPGDYIASYDGQQNPTWEQINVRSVLNLNHTVSAFVLRDGQRIPLQLPLADDSKGQEFTLGKVGLYPEIQPTPVKVAAVTPGLAAAKAGVQDGDLFDRIDGHAFHGTESIISYLKSRNGAPVNVVVDHNGKATQMTLQPTAVDVPEEGKAWRIGFAGNPPPMRVEHLPLLSATKESAKFCRANSLLIFEVLKRVLSHRMSVDTLSGPIGIAQQTGMAWEMKGWGPMIQLMTTISLNLGILNLLPFPILDGGMILFLLIEGAMQRDIDIRIKERVYQVAFVLILIFAAYVIFNDISKLATRT